MTGVSAFYFFSQAHIHRNQGRTLITIKHTHTQSSHSRTQGRIMPLKQEIFERIARERNIPLPTKEEQKKNSQRKDVPTYPEPEGCPSY